MIVTLQTAGLRTLVQVRAFVEGNAPVSFTLTERAAARAWMTDTLKRFRYGHCSRADKGLLRRYLAKVTGLGIFQDSCRPVGLSGWIHHSKPRFFGFPFMILLSKVINQLSINH